MLHLHTKSIFFFKKRPYVAIHTLATTEANHLKTDAHSVSSGVETTEHYNVLWEHTAGIVLIHVWYETPLQFIPQRQLWLFIGLYLQSMGDLHEYSLHSITTQHCCTMYLEYTIQQTLLRTVLLCPMVTDISQNQMSFKACCITSDLLL